MTIQLDLRDPDCARGTLQGETMLVPPRLALGPQRMPYIQHVPQLLAVEITNVDEVGHGHSSLMANGQWLVLQDDLGSDAGAAEDLQQQGVRDAAIDNVRLLHAAGEGGEAGLDLRQHARGDDA